MGGAWLVRLKAACALFSKCAGCFLCFQTAFGQPENLSLQIKQYLLMLCRSGEIGNGVRAFG